MNKSNEFLEDIAKLEAVEFIGLAKLLGVKLLEGKGENEKLRPMGDIVNDIMVKFSKLNRKKRRELKQIVRAAGRRIKK
jgi:hypothetical protein